ncbi:MAG: redox-sensing transcriptional repressor Rex [Oscillospiraceae bacterium]|nr:redox-sensing transcriptional repressor Rex [Oscillospiraceae bacterium]
MKKSRVSNAVIRRLPRYYRHLTELQATGVARISSNALGKAMGFTASQIRQDLSCFGEFGQRGYGYNVETLRGEIADILGMNEGHTAVIFGVGNLGRALIGNFNFGKNGVKLLAAFDVDEKIIGTELAGVPIRHPSEARAFLESNHVDVGVITVPKINAKDVARLLVSCGVKGIWNFANTDLDIGDNGNTVVENVHFADSLLALSYMISEE